MSFVKKGIKAIGKFVKKYWKEILIVAAVVFTAGILTVGVGAFSASVGANGFFSTVGSTMWAGVTGTAGSMGIGTGASGSIAGAAGVTGQGLGAAYGWGSAGLGLGMTSAEVAANTAALGVGATAPLSGVSPLASSVGKAAAPIVNPATGGTVSTLLTAPTTTAAAEAAGMSTGKALLWSGVLQTGGNMIAGYAQGEAMEDQLEAAKPYASWGVPTDDKGGRTGPVEDYLFEGAEMMGYQQPAYAPPAPMAGDVADPSQAASQLSLAQANRPMMQTMGGALMTQPGMPYAQRGVPTGPTTSPSNLMVGNPNLPASNGLMNEAWRIRPYGGVA